MLSFFLNRLRKNTSGVTAIEYGLIAGGIAVAIITIVFTLGTTLQDQFTTVNTKLTTAATPAAPATN